MPNITPITTTTATNITALPNNTGAQHSTLYVLRTTCQQKIPADLERIFSAHDALLLSGDAVYIFASALPVHCYALESDVRARGLLPHWPAHIPLINHGVFVDLCVLHQKMVSWS